LDEESKYGSLNGLQILHAKKTDYRADLFARTIKAGKEMQAANRKLLLRMRLCVFSILFCSEVVDDVPFTDSKQTW
jgi:hypothetical protein